MAQLRLTIIVIINILLKMTVSSPLYSAQFFSSQARNIRHLPCVSLRTGDTGVCMFAFNCVKANGTHLGTCLDRFYFGSCCKIDDEPISIFPHDNTIEDSSLTSTLMTTKKPIESNAIPDYTVIKPKPEKSSSKRPTTTTAQPYTTTQMSIGLSTFQTVQSSRPSSTQSPPMTSEVYSTTSRIISTTSESPKKRPTTVYTKPPISSTQTSEQSPLPTRFPPRNITTTSTGRPSTVRVSTTPKFTTSRPPASSSSATKRPSTSSGSKKPSKKPSATPKPATTSRPANFSTRPSQTASKPSSTVGVSSSHVPTKRPSTSSTATRLTTTLRPSTAGKPATFRPKPSSQATKPSATASPLTKPTARPTTQFTSKPRPSSTSVKTTHKPKPTGKPTKPAKPSQSPSTAAVSFSKIPNVTSTTAGSLVTTTTSVVSSVTTTRPTTMTNEILQSTATPGIITWSSNSDDHVTEIPVLSSTASTTQQSEETPAVDWSPITTPDGWIIIPSQSTKAPGVDETESAAKPAEINTTSTVAPTKESPTARPTLLTTGSESTSSIPELGTQSPLPTDRINMSDYKEVCGRRLVPESRIVGGAQSSFGQWPWQISLRQWRTSAFLHKCGAALLNENWAITAAHCVENVPPSDLLLRMGEYNLASEDEPYGFQERRVQIVASHPQFDPRTFEYDLALLRFYEPLLPFQPNYLPICLPDDDEGYVGHSAYVTGWGRLYEEGPLPSILQEVSVPVINNTVCEFMYKNAGYIEHIPHIFICAGWRDGGFDSCEGDSGGPMVIQRPRDKRWILAGVISWGIGCAEPNQPGVYTRISEFREWINQILQF